MPTHDGAAPSLLGKHTRTSSIEAARNPRPEKRLQTRPQGRRRVEKRSRDETFADDLTDSDDDEAAPPPPEKRGRPGPSSGGGRQLDGPLRLWSMWLINQYQADRDFHPLHDNTCQATINALLRFGIIREKKKGEQLNKGADSKKYKFARNFNPDESIKGWIDCEATNHGPEWVNATRDDVDEQMLFNRVQYLPNKQDLSCKMDQLSITTNPISGAADIQNPDNYKIIDDGLQEDQVVLDTSYFDDIMCDAYIAYIDSLRSEPRLNHNKRVR